MEHDVQDRMAQATIFPDVQEASDTRRSQQRARAG